MKFTEKFKKGIILTRQALNLVRKIKHLYLLPIMSGITTVLAFGLYISSAAWLFGGFTPMLENIGNNNTQSIALSALTFIFIYITQFITIFFNVATLAAVKLQLENKPSSVTIGLKVARQQINTIFKWTSLLFMITVALNKIVAIINKYTKFGGTIAQYFVGFSLGLGTYFILPVLVFTKPKPINKAIEYSAKLMKENFSENITAKIYLSTASTLIIALASLLFLTIFAIAPFILVEFIDAIGVGIFFISMIVLFIGSIFVVYTYFDLANQVLTVSLFDYAQTGTVTKEIDAEFIVAKRI